MNELPFEINDYNLSTENGSSFLDIGSGFGKPNFHAAMQTGCPSHGVEVVPARVAASRDQKYEFEEYYRKRIEKRERRSPSPAKKLAMSASKESAEKIAVKVNGSGLS